MFEIMVTSSILIIALVLLRYLLRNKISRRLQYALWLLVALRLLAPVTEFQNPLNVLNVLQASADGEKYSEQGADGNRHIVYRMESADGNQGVAHNGEQVDGRAESGQSNSGLTAEEIAGQQEQGMNAFAGDRELMRNREEPENQKGQENLGETDIQAALGTGEDILRLKEMEYFLEGGSWLNRFFLRGYGRYTWYLGMAVLGAWMLGCNLSFRLRMIKNRMFLGREGGLKVYMAEGISAPCLFGILHPAVYLTRESALNPRHREHTILHELTHYRHKDHIWAFVRNICLVIYWFDPLVWLAVYLSARDCEMACDEGVACRIGEEHIQEYGCTLIEMASVSSRKMRMLRCAAGFSVRKQELKERISRIAGGRKRTGILVTVLVIACGTALAACTFGGAEEENIVGRYEEEIVELPAEYEGAVLARDGDTIRLIDPYGSDLLSVDGGNTFEAAETIPNAVRSKSNATITGLAGTVDGTRIYNLISFGKVTWKLITGENEEIKLEGSGENNFYPTSIYEEGYFYSFNMNQVYKTDAVTGETSRLAETIYPIVSLAVGEHILYAITYDGLYLYDLDSGERLAKQDELLGEYFGEKALNSLAKGFPVILYPSGEEIYILSHDGLYRHTLYGDTMELVLDSGVFGSISDDGRAFSGMVVTEGEVKGKDTFLILYSDGSLIRYVFNPELTSEPDLRIYSVYEDVNVIRAVNAYRAAHPELTVVYEVSYKSNYGATLQDVLNNLSTEIAAGTGPDILVMDAIPFQSYAEKGVLMDLSFLRDTMTEEAYFTTVVDGYAAEEGLFAMPMAFVVPVIGADSEWTEQLKTAKSLSDLADILEEARRKFPEGDLIHFLQAEHTLSQLSEASMGAWTNDEGGIDREAVTEFLTQAKRIYDAQKEGTPEEMENWYADDPLETLDANMITRIFGEDMNRALGIKQYRDSEGDPSPFYTDYLRENYAQINGYLEYFDADITLLPGQEYGTCLPVTVLAVNQRTTHEQESREFMELVFSEEGQSSLDLFGFPVSREAYRLSKIDPTAELEGYIYKGAFYIGKELGPGDYHEYGWPSEEAFQRLDALLGQVTGVAIWDRQVYDTVIRLGQAALKGESDIEETVDAIEKALQIYLAE